MWRLDGEHIVRRQRSPYPLERKLSNRLYCDGALDLRQHPRTNQDLPWLRFVAKTGGDIGYRPYRGIVEAPLEADGAERGKAVRDAEFRPEPDR
jgi:hypothetical protein